LAAKSAVPASSGAPEAAAAAGGSKTAKAAPASGRVPEAVKAARGLPPPGKRVADFATDISVDDYLVGKSLARVFFNLLIRRRVGRRPT
jgi:propanediol dehydratase small subunit